MKITGIGDHIGAVISRKTIVSPNPYEAFAVLVQTFHMIGRQQFRVYWIKCHISRYGPACAHE